MKKIYEPKVFAPTRGPREPLKVDFNTEVAAPGLLSRMLGGRAKHEAALEAASRQDQQSFQDAHDRWLTEFAEWQRSETSNRAKFDREEAARRKGIEDHNAAIEEFAKSYKEGSTSAVSEYFNIILDRLVLPDQFPTDFRISFLVESKQLVVEHTLPVLDIVPSVGEYSYVKSKDEIREKPRKKAEVKELYETTVAGTSLRIIHEIFFSDQAAVVDSLVFNGIVKTVSPETGDDIAPCIVSVRVTRAEFAKINLSRIDPLPCLRALGAISKKPDELAPVRPIVEFDMVDPRFVSELDVISNLESRPNIMELSPFEFENLVTNLFSKMGFDMRQTRSSGDGGVDAVAFDPRPVLGGKIVIQAKRYKNTVGVAAVRELYGTMINEGASKGILVTTAGYGPAAFEFAKDKPIELFEGTRLLYLLEEQGIAARIVMPG